MFTRFDANKSTKGASKLRRDLINAEIANLRDLLPLPPSTRQRLSQLQLMALVCVYVRKANYFQQVFKRHDIGLHHVPTPNIGFSKALSGFLMMMTQNGKLLYISDNAAEYLGHSMEDLLIHGDSVYDIIDKQDHQAIQTELGRTPHGSHVPTGPGGSGLVHGPHGPHGTSVIPDGEQRMFLCRMNVSRNARRQMRFGDQKVVLIQGHYLSFLPLCSRNEPVFLATCTPIAMPETRECVVQGATNVFTTVHGMDMKIIHIDKNGEFHLGFTRAELQGASWYQLLHWDYTREAQTKHRLITQSEQDRSCILLVRLQRRTGDWLWVHSVLQVKDGSDSSQQPVIVCTNQVLSEREASVMRLNSWLYHYYSVQSKLQYGLAFEASRMPSTPPTQYYHSPLQPPAMSPYPHHSYIHHQLSPAPNHIQHGQHLNGAGPTHHYLAPLCTPESPSGNTNVHNPSSPYSSYRLEPEPVDYSINPNDVHMVDASRRNMITSPPAKRKMKMFPNIVTSKLEPLYIPSSVSPHTELIVGLDHGGREDGGGTLLLSSSIPRPRLLVKAPLLPDPAEFIDQWNPSPPWSDGALQKVPDLTHQELSPYLTTTPPTPTSAPYPHVQQAFSFDWMPEQFVPNMQCGSRPGQDDCHIQDVGIWPPGEPRFHGDSGTLSWPAEHRLFPLQPPPPPRITPVRVESETLEQPLNITDAEGGS